MKLKKAKFLPLAVSAALLLSCSGDDGDPSIAVDDDTSEDDGVDPGEDDDGDDDPAPAADDDDPAPTDDDDQVVEADTGAEPVVSDAGLDGGPTLSDADAPDADTADADTTMSDAEAPDGGVDAAPAPVCGKPMLVPALDDLEGFNPGDNPIVSPTWNRGDVIRIVTTAVTTDSLDSHDGGADGGGHDAGDPAATDAGAPMTSVDASSPPMTSADAGPPQVGNDASVVVDGGGAAVDAGAAADAAAPFVPTPQANSGTQSILFFDDAADDAPELRGAFAAAATRGVFQASMYISPEAENRRDTVFSIYGNDTSDAGRLGSFRLRSDGSTDFRITVDGSNSWMDIASDVFAPETWVDVEVAWDSSDGCNRLWLSVDGVVIGDFPAFLNEPALGVGIRTGDNSGTDTEAATFIDDIGFITEP